MSKLEYSAHFTVKWRKEYRQNKEKKFTVEELGRIFRSNPLEIKTWSKASGLPIPEVCRVPFVNPPKLLPLSLRIDRWVEDLENYFFDVTSPQLGGFKIKLPPKDVAEIEFLNMFDSTEKCLIWALREGADVGYDIDFFIQAKSLRIIASSAYQRVDWKYAVLLLKEKIFIDRIIDEDDKFWKRGLSEPDFQYKKNFRMPIDPSEYIGGSPISVPHCSYSEEFLRERDFTQYGKKFEDIMKSGGPGDPLYNGDDVDVRSTKLLTLENHKLVTVTRLSCQSPDGPVDSQENYVEIKTMFPFTQEKFAKFKSRSLWIHCALVGISTVYCGIRSADGNLIDVIKYSMEELADIGKEYWNPNEILTFLDTVLSWLKQKLNKTATRTKHGEEWLRAKISAEEAPTFTLSCDGHGYIKLSPEEHSGFRRVITEKYDHLVKCRKTPGTSKTADDDESDDESVPDTWDDSD